jgi:SAM-dependent methyltransferase
MRPSYRCSPAGWSATAAWNVPPSWWSRCAGGIPDRIDTEERFDTVLMVAFIEHVYNQKRLFTEVLRHLQPDGRIVITTPTPRGDRIHCWGTSLSLFAQAAKDDHPIIFSKQRFRVFAKHFGLEIEAYRRFQLGCNQLVVLRRRGS